MEDAWQVGACAMCRVAFAGRRAEMASLGHLLRVHESICPGGDRAGEVVRPLEASRPAQLWRPPLSLDN